MNRKASLFLLYEVVSSFEHVVKLQLDDITTMNQLSSLMQGRPAVLRFLPKGWHKSECMKCREFDKLWSNIGLAMQDRGKVLELPCDEYEFQCIYYGMPIASDVPMFLSWDGFGWRDRYSGERSFGSLGQWVLQAFARDTSVESKTSDASNHMLFKVLETQDRMDIWSLVGPLKLCNAALQSSWDKREQAPRLFYAKRVAEHVRSHLYLTESGWAPDKTLPNPVRGLMLGLGGGTLAADMLCNHGLDNSTEVFAVELDEHMIRLAEKEFMPVMFSGCSNRGKLQVLHDDALVSVDRFSKSHEAFNIIIIDLPPDVLDRDEMDFRWWKMARSLLTKKGLLIINTAFERPHGKLPALAEKLIRAEFTDVSSGIATEESTRQDSSSKGFNMLVVARSA